VVAEPGVEHSLAVRDEAAPPEAGPADSVGPAAGEPGVEHSFEVQDEAALLEVRPVDSVGPAVAEPGVEHSFAARDEAARSAAQRADLLAGPDEAALLEAQRADWVAVLEAAREEARRTAPLDLAPRHEADLAVAWQHSVLVRRAAVWPLLAMGAEAQFSLRAARPIASVSLRSQEVVQRLPS